MQERGNAAAACDAALIRGARHAERARAHGRYVVECIGADGQPKWADSIANLVTTEGKNYALDQFLAGAGYTAAWFIGLISSAAYELSVDDTAAQIGGSNGWAEAGSSNVPNYDESTRPAVTWEAAADGSKAVSSPAAFTISELGTVKGCFLSSSSEKDGISGVLYSAGLFASGDKTVSGGDTLYVSYTASL